MGITRDNVENLRDLPQPPSLESGTSILVVQANAPTGWVLSTAHNDRVLRVVSNFGGGVGGTWNLTGITTGAHTLTIAEIPSHNHGYNQFYIDYDLGESNELNNNDGGYRIQTTGSTGGGGSHTHPMSSDNSWRPSYVDAIIVTRS